MGQVRTVRSAVVPRPRDLYAEGRVECCDVAVGRARREDPPPRGRRDWVLAAILMAAVAFEAVVHRNLVWRPVAIGFGCGLAAAVLFRRTHCLMAVAFGFGTFAVLDVATFVADAGPLVLHSGAVVLVLAYSLRWGAGRDARADRHDGASHTARWDTHGGTETRSRLGRAGCSPTLWPPTPRDRDVTVRVIIADDQSIIRAGLSTASKPLACSLDQESSIRSPSW